MNDESDNMTKKNAVLRKLTIPRFQILNTQISALTPPQLLTIVAGWIKEQSKHYINVFTVDSILKCVDSPTLADIANNSSLTIPDGMPLVFLGKRAGFNVERCYGPDMMLKIMENDFERGYNYKHFFYGCTDDVLEKLESNLRRKFPEIKIVGKIAPPFRPLTDKETISYSKQINESKADIVWCGLGTPKQDYWISNFRAKLDAPILIAVGAAFNFHAGNVKQAPRWMMRCGLEWFFRLCMEPKRLWRRYIIGNTRFIFLLLKQIVTKKPAPLGRIKPK